MTKSQALLILDAANFLVDEIAHCKSGGHLDALADAKTDDCVARNISRAAKTCVKVIVEAL